MCYSFKISKDIFKLESNQVYGVEVQLNNDGIIKCCIQNPPVERKIKERLYPDLLDFIQKALIEICDCCIPSAQKPVCYLECPFDHDDKGPHLLFNEISDESGIICTITNTPVPKTYYSSLFKSNCTCVSYV